MSRIEYVCFISYLYLYDQCERSKWKTCSHNSWEASRYLKKQGIPIYTKGTRKIYPQDDCTVWTTSRYRAELESVLWSRWEYLSSSRSTLIYRNRSQLWFSWVLWVVWWDDAHFLFHSFIVFPVGHLSSSFIGWKISDPHKSWTWHTTILFWFRTFFCMLLQK